MSQTINIVVQVNGADSCDHAVEMQVEIKRKKGFQLGAILSKLLGCNLLSTLLSVKQKETLLLLRNIIHEHKIATVYAPKECVLNDVIPATDYSLTSIKAAGTAARPSDKRCSK